LPTRRKRALAFLFALELCSKPGLVAGSRLVKTLGSMRGAVAGLLTMMAGCLLFIPASQTALFAMFLLACFELASGVVLVQILANPLSSLLGPERTTHGRLTFAQAFNSLGTTIFAYFGAILIPGGLAGVSATDLSGAELAAYRTAESEAIVSGFLGLAAAFVVVAGVVWLLRDRLKGETHAQTSLADGLALLQLPRFSYGAACIFLYVGAEVAIGSFIGSLVLRSVSPGLAPPRAHELNKYARTGG
jgi:FHS family L-fucose permease-like MFS transporter